MIPSGVAAIFYWVPGSCWVCSCVWRWKHFHAIFGPECRKPWRTVKMEQVASLLYMLVDVRVNFFAFLCISWVLWFGLSIICLFPLLHSLSILFCGRLFRNFCHFFWRSLLVGFTNVTNWVRLCRLNTIVLICGNIPWHFYIIYYFSDNLLIFFIWIAV